MRVWRHHVAAAAASALAVMALAVPAGAETGAVTPAGARGPALSADSDDLARSLECSANLATSTEKPVLLVPGTTLNPTEEYAWNYQRAFERQNRPHCTVRLPGNAMGDIQVAAEYVVHSIRTMYRLSGRRVQILGHSQGGMVPRWALKFWPDTRDRVDDVVALAGSNHGTVDANVLCAPAVGCAPSVWQQRTNSDFLRVLNSGGETYPGVSYTNVYTTLVDEVVQPNLTDSGSTPLHGGGGDITNVAVQDVCPAHVTDHLLVGTSDPVAYALAMDALTRAGPAEPEAIDESVCARAFQPGVNPATFPLHMARMTTTVTRTLALHPHVAREPELKPYARDPGRD